MEEADLVGITLQDQKIDPTIVEKVIRHQGTSGKEDAYDAIKELQGFDIEGNPLRIEYAKVCVELHVSMEKSSCLVPRLQDLEKSLVPPRDADYYSEREQRDNPYPRGRGSPFSSRDSRLRYSSPELSHHRKSKMSDKNAEPSEVLWIGYPAQLKVDEFVLRKAFSPFGDIEKITAFPGRTYAFVYFRDVMAACNAKETLQGKLFGNPRVNICFAKNDIGPSNRERDHSITSPNEPHLEYGDRNTRHTDSWSGRNNIHERRRFPGQGSVLGMSTDIYDDPHSHPRNMRAHIREFSPEGYPHQGPIYDDPWDLPEDVSLLHGSGLLDNNDRSRHSGYRPISKRLMNTGQPYDDFQVAPMPMHPLDRRKLTPDSRESSSKEVWRWEGMIAKGGTTVCRARCWPEVLDCTARTSLDMLAKHYYQAASASAAFFAPANDPDISYYNEFMSYLGEKQRAAVVKLDERNTLFLVPPSEFSEKVLKLPGKVCISGVVLRLDPPGSSHGFLPPNENRETPFNSFQNDSVYQNSVSPLGPYLPPPPPLINDMRSVDAQLPSSLLFSGNRDN
ncbi:hypothetical protein SASPL_117281 [Salvia splendens]|uniref:RRM domain-containing protein n=1 Tax=Salvia splendens TaxID=180675 RepID=A0A8X8XV86_SALSN|nr:hypothetical protein SASPL_117281 [Salvia splendens]